MRHQPLRSKKRWFILLAMVEFRYRGREITQEDILYICSLIERHPNDSRRKLSTRLCEAWQWRQTNGTLRDMVCRGLLLMLERAGQISLPPVSYVRHNPLAQRVRPEPVLVDRTPLEERLCNLQPLEFAPVRRTATEPLFNSLMEEHHYLGYEQPVGEHLKYVVWALGRPIACVAWSVRAAAHRCTRPLHRMERRSAPAQHPLPRLQHAVSDSAVGQGGAFGVPYSRAHDGTDFRLTGSRCTATRFTLRKLSSTRRVFAGPVTARRTGCGWATPPGAASIEQLRAEPPDQGNSRLSLDASFPRTTQPDMTMNIPRRRRLDVDLDELDQIIDDAKTAPLSEAESQKLKTALHALAEKLLRKRNTEKTSSPFCRCEKAALQDLPAEADQPSGHGRKGAAAFSGADKVRITHAKLAHGDLCPDCARGKVYRQKEPKALVRIAGQAPLAATVYEMERLRCNACGEVFTAEEPEGVGPEKYDETAAAMIAQLKYGSGVPFNRLEGLQEHLGMPLPATTQWEMVAAAAKLIWPALVELIRQAAQGSVMHNDDTGMRILRLAREPGDKRTGTFTSGIVSMVGAWTVALFFTGWKHAGENLAEVLKQRARELPAADSDERCVITQLSEAGQASSPCRRTASRMEGGRLWRWRRTFRKNAVMCWRRCATFIITTHKRESGQCRRNNGCASIRSAAGR